MVLQRCSTKCLGDASLRLARAGRANLARSGAGANLGEQSFPDRARKHAWRTRDRLVKNMIGLIYDLITPLSLQDFNNVILILNGTLIPTDLKNMISYGMAWSKTFVKTGE